MDNEKEAVFLLSKISDYTMNGNANDALILLKQLETKFNRTKNYLLNVPECYIEIGDILKSKDYVQKGINLGLEALDIFKENKQYFSLINYNIANGYYSLYEISKNLNEEIDCFTFKPLQEAKKYFRESINVNENNDDSTFKQALVNLANVYDILGRTVEAIHLYEKVLNIDNNFSMAKANLGEALLFFADISGHYRGATLKEAYRLISESVEDSENILKIGGIQALKNFKNDLEKIKSQFKDKSTLQKSTAHPSINNNSLTKEEKEYYYFCFRNKLFLNFHIHKSDILCKASIIDNVSISMVVNIKEKNKYLFYMQYLNQIKEDFSTARYLLFLSQYKQPIINRISKLTKYFDTLDYSDNNLYIGFLKTAFNNSFNILDKIARFLNDYLNIGINGDIYYTSIWTQKINKKKWEIIPKIREQKNLCILGLFDIYLDFQSGPYKYLKEIRNKNTHEKLIVYDDFFDGLRNERIDPDAISILSLELLNKTIELMLIVKSCIFNLINFINFEENKKKLSKKSILPFYYFEKKQNL